jgi:hypothetical protein
LRANRERFDDAMVAHEREFAENRVEQMSSNIANTPLRGDGREVPFFRKQCGEKFEKLGVYLAEQMSAKYGLNGRHELIVPEKRLNAETRREQKRG